MHIPVTYPHSTLQHTTKNTASEHPLEEILRSPVSFLPNELLVEIFQAGQSLSSSTAVGLPFRVLVSHVSHRWRTIAVNTPLLWTRIDASSQPLSSLESCIQRSKPCPLDIYIRLDEFDNPRRHPLKQILDLIIPDIERWHRLIVDARFFSSISQIYMALREQSASQLKHIGMCLTDPFGLEELWREPEDSYLGILAGGAPKLSSFKLLGISLHYCHPPINSLTSLSLTTPFDSETALPLTYDKLRQVLTTATSLTELALHGRVLFIEGQNPPVVEVPSLRKLMISSPADSSDHECNYIVNLCTFICAPMLSSLSLNFFGRIQSSVSPFLKSLRIRSTSPNSPILSGGHSNIDADVSFTLPLRSIQSSPLLDTDPTQVRETLVTEITSALSPDWTHLQSITATMVDEDRLSRLLSSRISAGRSIKELHISNSQVPASRVVWLEEQLRG